MLARDYKIELGITVKENIIFDIKNESEYINEFKFLQSLGTIDAKSSFYDEVWYIWQAKAIIPIKFPFNEVWLAKLKKQNKLDFSYNEFNTAVRRFMVEVLKSYAAKTCGLIVSELFRLINSTEFFSIDKSNEFQEVYSTKKLNFTRLAASLEFFSFFEEYDLPYQYREDAIELLMLNTSETNVRKLPSFEDVFDFHDIINRFMIEATGDEKAKYFPIILWWKITNLIPLRTSEFIATKKDCIKQVGDKFYMHIRRSNLKGKRSLKNKLDKSIENVYSEEIIEIDKDIYNLVNSYLNLVKNEVDDEEREFMFSYKFYLKYSGNSGASNLYNIERFLYRNMSTLLAAFHMNIVEKKYNRNVVDRTEEINLQENSLKKKIAKMQTYDTRHLAIINLIFLGCEAETIKRLAGHETMESTMGYYEHYKEYVRSYAIAYAKSLYSEKCKEKSLVTNPKKNNIQQEKRMVMWDEIINKDRQINIRYKKVDGGYCKHKLDTYKQCIQMEGVHQSCPYFIAESDDELLNEIKNVNHQISAELATLKEIMANEKMISNVSEKRAVLLERMRRLSNSKAEVMSNLSSIDIIEASEGVE